ncbi:MAG: OadG family protein [Bacillota bacterium]
MNIDWNMLYKGLNVALYGLIGVFSVLILFYIVTKLMVIAANKFDKKDAKH